MNKQSFKQLKHLIAHLPKSKILAGESVPNGKYRFYLSGQKEGRINVAISNQDAIIMGDGGVASIDFAKGKYSYSSHNFGFFSNTENIETKYIYRAIEQFLPVLDYKGFVGSGIKNIDKSFLFDLYIQIPPLPEQKKIASILMSVDEVIKNTQRQINKLQDLKKAIMSELLTKGIGHAEFKDSELGRIPKSWRITTLESIGDFAKGKGISKKETTSNGVPCVRYAEIYTEYNYVIDKFKSFISTKTINITKKLKTNDIIFAGSGETVEDIGKSVAFVSNFDAYVGGDTIIFSPNIECNSVFLSYQLNDDLRRIQLRKFGQGSSVIHIYASGIKQLKIVLPPITEQNKIAEIFLSYAKIINTKINKLTKVKSLKKSLMQDLLVGKVRVKVN
jgi:type I restriction enzyme, S subunit